MEWRNIKVHVSSPEMSKAFQEEAFKNGVLWRGGDDEVMQENRKFLFIDANGYLTWDDDQEYYECKSNKEVIVETTYKYSLNEEDTIEFDGKTYNKAKFLNAIKGLEQ